MDTGHGVRCETEGQILGHESSSKDGRFAIRELPLAPPIVKGNFGSRLCENAE